MILAKQESLRVMQLWNDYGNYLESIFIRMMKEAEENLNSGGDQFHCARQTIDYLARKQTLIDLKKILSNRYD